MCIRDSRSIFRHLYAAAADKLHKHRDKLRIELPAGFLQQDMERLLEGVGLFVGTLRDHGVEGIRDAEDAGPERNILAGDPAGITLSVVMLMMPDNRGNDVVEGGEMAERVIPAGSPARIFRCV